MSVDVQMLVTERNIRQAGGLLLTLAPRAQVFSFFDHDRHCSWTTDGAEDYEVESFVSALPKEVWDRLAMERGTLRRTLASGRTILAFPVPDEFDGMAGLLVALFTKNDGKSSSLDPNILKKVLTPAIDLIAESQRVQQTMRRLEETADVLEKELEFVYQVDEKIHTMARRHAGLAQLVGRSGRYRGINYSVLLIPSKHIRVSATHSSWKNVDRKVLDKYMIEQLMPKLEAQRKTVIVEFPASSSGEGATRGQQALLCPILDKHGNLEGVLTQLGRVDGLRFGKNDRRFIAHLGRKIESIIEESFDAMTGLMNRSGFEAQLQESYDALESPAVTHQLIYFDLDNLQLVNDTFSRVAGDDVIKTFARLLEEDLPKSAVLARLTGDDFCMLLTKASSEEALEVANSMRRKATALRYLEGDKSLQVTMSIGIAEFNHDTGGDGAALTTARMACEKAKEQGRDRTEIYDENNRSLMRRYDDMQLVAEIQQALDDGTFELLVQPIDELADTAERHGFEVLLRMKDNEGGYVESDALFSAAERYRMMPQIDRWVVSNTIARLSELADKLSGSGVCFAINLSGQSIGDHDFLEFIEQELDRSDLPASQLHFEITESAAVSNLNSAQEFIDRLRERGSGISLDDFGAGLSSFAYLKNFNVDILKIDGSFIRDITENRISESMVFAITQVAKVMELKTVAEYVETEASRELITRLGVDFAQGHHIGDPQRLDVVLDELASKAKASGKPKGGKKKGGKKKKKKGSKDAGLEAGSES